MKTKNFKLPLTLTFLAAILVLALTANYSANSIPTAVGVDGKLVLILDAGHGGMDSGCVGINGELEKEINLAIVKNLEQMFKFSGVDVVLTRSEDVSIHDKDVEGIRHQKVSDMENRKKILQEYPNSIFLSIHQNQFTSRDIFGAQMFYSTNNKDNFKLAQMMQDNFKFLDSNNHREVKIVDSDLYLFKNTAQPALLIECGFLSNPNDAANLSDSDYQKKVAFSIYKTITEFLKVTVNEETEETDFET